MDQDEAENEDEHYYSINTFWLNLLVSLLHILNWKNKNAKLMVFRRY
jgi:hypothetical protein